MVQGRALGRGRESADRELLAAARRTLRTRHRAKLQTVAAALRGASGRIYVGLNLNAKYVGRVDVCAEAIALGTAVTAGEREFDAIVAVQRPRASDRSADGRVVPPCGICREMLSDYAPDMDVLMPTDGGVRRRRLSELLPDKYRDP